MPQRKLDATVESIAADMEPIIIRRMQYLDHVRHPLTLSEEMRGQERGRSIDHMSAAMDILGSGLHGIVEAPERPLNLTTAVAHIISALAHMALAKGTKWQGGA